MELFSPEWFAALAVIVLVDLLLAGDNALVIAMAARNLPPVWKKRAVIWGTFGAIAARIVIAVFIAKLLELPFLKLVGGLLLYVIAWRLLANPSGEGTAGRAATGFWSAMGTIIAADTLMGLDNVLAIAAAARGDVWLIVLGIAISIPIMMGGSVLILSWLKKAPWLEIVGSALLSGIAGRIAFDDDWVRGALGLGAAAEWAAVLAAAAVVTAGAVFWKRWKDAGKSA